MNNLSAHQMYPVGTLVEFYRSDGRLSYGYIVERKGHRVVIKDKQFEEFVEVPTSEVIGETDIDIIAWDYGDLIDEESPDDLLQEWYLRKPIDFSEIEDDEEEDEWRVN